MLIDGSRSTGWTTTRSPRCATARSGSVFQFHHLLREFTALENVMMPLRIGGSDEVEARRRAMALLERVGLGGRATIARARCRGEQQRTAVRQALAADPAVLLADEPRAT